MDISNRSRQAESTKRRRIEPTNVYTNYCSRCKSMFSPTGLMEMNSKEGFKHYKRQECEDSARNGCTLCKTIVTSGALGEWIPKRNNHLTMFSTLKSKCTWNEMDINSSNANLTPALPACFDGIRGWPCDRPKEPIHTVVVLTVCTKEGISIEF